MRGDGPPSRMPSFEDGGEETDELVGLGEEGVVAVVGGHFAVVAAGSEIGRASYRERV